MRNFLFTNFGLFSILIQDKKDRKVISWQKMKTSPKITIQKTF